jgi:plastocyanin
MIILDSTTKSLEVKLAGAITTNQLDITCHAVDTLDADQSVSDIVNTDIATNNATAVTAMAAPAASHTREVKTLTVYNKDTVAATVTVQKNDNGTLYILVKVTLDPGDTLQYTSED